MPKLYTWTNQSDDEYNKALDDTFENSGEDIERVLIFEEWVETRLQILAQFPKGVEMYHPDVPGIRCAHEQNSKYNIFYEEIPVGAISIRIVKFCPPRKDKETTLAELKRLLF